jgi:hypothetical protein
LCRRGRGNHREPCLSQSLLLRPPVRSPLVRRWPSSVKGLALRYKLDEGAGKVAFDSSGLHRHGTINGTGLYAPSPVGKCLYFDGTGDYVATPSFGLSGTVVVFAANVRCSIHATNRQSLLSDASSSPTIGYLWSYRHEGASDYNLWWQFADGSAATSVAASNYFAGPYNDAWLHCFIVCDYGGKVTYFYRNGVLFTSQGMSGTPVFPSVNRTKYIGSYNTGFYFLTDGYLANVYLGTLATCPPVGVLTSNANRLMLGINPIW